jgi:hypothetical protein
MNMNNTNTGFEKLNLAELESLSAVGGNDAGVNTEEFITPTIGYVSWASAGFTLATWLMCK